MDKDCYIHTVTLHKKQELQITKTKYIVKE